MKNYTNFKAINADLERLKLERDIAWEELKLTKHEFKDNFSTPSWLEALGKAFAKYGFFLLLKRIFK